jgi:hypothetical protein
VCKKGLLILISFFFLGSLLLADEPPSYEEFEILSENGKYLAQVTADVDDDVKQPWELTYTLTVYQANDDSLKEMWSCKYIYDGYPYGILTNDGSTFVYVCTWYFEDSYVVLIYRWGKEIKMINGDEFHVRKSKMIKTASHRLWYLEDSIHIKNSSILKLKTIDRKKHLIDLTSGEFIH